MDPTRPEKAWWGEVARGNVRAFCESLCSDGMHHPAPGIVAWEVRED